MHILQEILLHDESSFKDTHPFYFGLPHEGQVLILSQFIDIFTLSEVVFLDVYKLVLIWV